MPYSSQLLPSTISSILQLSPSDLSHQITLLDKIIEDIDPSVVKIRNWQAWKLLAYELMLLISESEQEGIQANSSKGRKKKMQKDGNWTIDKIWDIIDHIDLRPLPNGCYSITSQNLNLLKEHLSSLPLSSKAPLSMHSDSESQLLIEQLEEIVLKKEARIKELNRQLEENFEDNQQIQEEMEEMERKNRELEEKIEQLEAEMSELRKSSGKIHFQRKEKKESKEKTVQTQQNNNHESEDTATKQNNSNIQSDGHTSQADDFYKPKSHQLLSMNEETPQKQPAMSSVPVTIKKYPSFPLQEQNLMEDSSQENPIILETVGGTIERMLMAQAILIQTLLKN